MLHKSNSWNKIYVHTTLEYLCSLAYFKLYWSIYIASFAYWNEVEDNSLSIKSSQQSQESEQNPQCDGLPVCDIQDMSGHCAATLMQLILNTSKCEKNGPKPNKSVEHCLSSLAVRSSVTWYLWFLCMHLENAPTAPPLWLRLPHCPLPLPSTGYLMSPASP